MVMDVLLQNLFFLDKKVNQLFFTAYMQAGSGLMLASPHTSTPSLDDERIQRRISFEAAVPI